MHESDTLEFKEVVTQDLKKEIVAFANSNGGEILIGVNRDGEIVGIKDTDIEMQKIGNMIRDGIHPDLTQFTKIERIEQDDKQIIRISVQSAIKKPYHLSDKGLKPSGDYIRHGVSSVPASETVIREFIRDTDGIEYDSMRCLNQTLTFSQAEYYFTTKQLLFDETHKRNLGLLDEDNFYTNTALLFSDQCEHTTKCAIFQGESKLVVRSRKEFTGSILKQLDEVMTYVSMFSEDHTQIKGMSRIDTPDYPIEALREVLLNALVHRDYSFKGSIIINIFDSRIEFISLGSLVKNLSYLDIMSGASETRNRKVASIFYRLEYVEAYGMGIQKIMELYRTSQDKPTFIVNPSSFIATLPKHKTIEKATKHESREGIVFRRIKEEGSITRKEVEELLACSSFTANKVLNALLSSHKIRCNGVARATYYTVY